MNRIQLPIMLLVLSASLVAGCGKTEENAGQKSREPDLVPTFSLSKGVVEKELSIPGELSPLERAEIFAKVSGYVKTMQVDIGDAVQRGQVIATLDAPEMMANYAQANADVQVAKAKYLGALDAFKRLADAARVAGTIAAGETEKSRNQLLADSSAWEAAKSKLTAYARLNDYLTIKAPFAGVVTQRNIDPGALVGAANTKPMLVIENNSQLRLRLPVPEAYLAATPENAAVHFTVDAYPGVQFDAKLSRKAGALNLVNRTEAWEFICNNAGKRLKSGMFANCSIQFKRSNPSFVAPATAVVTNQEKRFVIRVKNNKAEWVDVRNGFSLGDKIEIFGNLAEGDTIVLRGNDEIKPDSPLAAKLD